LRADHHYEFYLIRTWKECAASVFHTTRAVAEAPEKLKKNLAGSASKIILV
jgi:hypothetical protein